MQGMQVEKKKLISVGLPLRFFEVTRLPSRSLRSKGGISVTAGYGDGHGAMPRSFTDIVTAVPSTARSTLAPAPGLPMATTKPPNSTGLHAESRYSMRTVGPMPNRLRNSASVGWGF